MMATDASIYGQIKQPQILNPLAQLAQAQQLQGITQQNRLAQLQMQEYERKRAQDEEQRQIVSGFGADTAANEQALIRAGNLGAAQSYRKGIAEQNKLAGEADAQKLKVARERIDLMGQGLGFVMQNPTLENAQSAISRLASAGVLDQAQAQDAWAKFQANPTPEGIRAFAQQGYQASLSSKDQLMKFETRNTGATTDTLAQNPVTGQVQVANSVNNTQSPDAILSAQTSRANNAASVAATIRGQNITDSRARESNALQREAARNQLVETDGGYVLVDKATGQAKPATINGEAIPGKEKPLTEGQSKAALFGARMKAANDIFDNLQRNGTVTATPGMNAPVIGGAITALSGSNQQSLDQARRDFINAVLRRESGAAIASSEFENANRQYFPQIGDSAQVIEQKKANRERAVRGLVEELPSRQRDNIVNRIAGNPSSGGQTKPSQLSDDDLLKKYGGR